MVKKEEWLIEDRSPAWVRADLEEKLPDPGPLVIKVAPTGVILNRAQNPHLPYTPWEIAEATAQSYKAGACGVHMHFRDRYGCATPDMKLFKQQLKLTLAKCKNILIDAETIIGKWPEEAAAPVVERYIEMTPLNPLISLLGDFPFQCDKPMPKWIQDHAKLCQENGVKLELAVYDPSHINNAYRYLIKPGILEKPYYWLICVGLPGCTPGGPEGLMFMLRRVLDVDREPVWMVESDGRAAFQTAITAVMLGGHVRIGLEDIVYKYPWSDVRADSNAELVQRTVKVAEAYGRKIADADYYRKIVGLPKRRRDPKTLKLL